MRTCTLPTAFAESVAALSQRRGFSESVACTNIGASCKKLLTSDQTHARNNSDRMKRAQFQAAQSTQSLRRHLPLLTEDGAELGDLIGRDLASSRRQ
jgi:hypothetical protein